MNAQKLPWGITQINTGIFSLDDNVFNHHSQFDCINDALSHREQIIQEKMKSHL